MRRTLAIIGGLALAMTLSQFPEYAQQYTQRLGGAVDELHVIAEEFDQAAAEAGLTRDAALERYAVTGDVFIEGRGRSMAQTIARYETLRLTLAEIQGATGWERFANLPRYLDTDIGARALEDYRPAVPVTIESFAYAAAGFVVGYLVISSAARFFALILRRRHPRRA